MGLNYLTELPFCCRRSRHPFTPFNILNRTFRLNKKLKLYKDKYYILLYKTERHVQELHYQIW